LNVHDLFQFIDRTLNMTPLSLPRPLSFTRAMALAAAPASDPASRPPRARKALPLRPVGRPTAMARAAADAAKAAVAAAKAGPVAASPAGVMPTAAPGADAFGAVPFADAAQAWFWTVSALAARHGGAGGRGGRGGRLVPRPCDPDDVILALDLLHRRGTIGLPHAKVLRRWGDLGRAPDAMFERERRDAALWAEAVGRLEGVLRAKRIVAAVT
jgi:hypothetical protein